MAKAHHPKLTTQRLQELIDEATVDAQDGSEQLAGLENALQENLELPFTTVVLGISVTVDAIDEGPDGSLTARCVAGRHRQLVPLFYLPDPEPLPKGWEWVEAYRHWCRVRV